MHNETWENQDSDFENTNSFSENDHSKNDEKDVVTDEHPNETPEEGESKKEGTGYHSQSEVDQPQRGANTSFSEQTDVTPPNKHEFPSVGPSKTDFESRPQGRTTGRMVGHEPGTEGV
ncbi:hypothetical protein SAMN05216464_101115 [Mucilaginibacter pineti]|uniref:Uncharacterized protein n=2 Tax=Mucilaginibacter pineti TaxID=1391627 RepID=A0A1G6T123_9SPHI|nr:hypothetical protein SAMN05216464_101115 [Mucilaginibacter pineti]